MVTSKLIILNIPNVIITLLVFILNIIFDFLCMHTLFMTFMSFVFVVVVLSHKC